jgi:predicted  nucleic acid-binding Zn-ribbon protein
MSNIWDDLKKNLKVWGSAAAVKAEELGKVAASKTEEMTKIGRVKLQMHQLQRELDKILQELGEFVFGATDNENVSNFTGNEKYYATIEKAKKLKLKITDKRAEIEKIRQEFEEAARSIKPEIGESVHSHTQTSEESA